MNQARIVRLQDLFLGSIDAKNDILSPNSQTAQAFEDSFVVPKDFSTTRFEEGRIQFAVGTKGTGKTALLRWLERRRQHKGDKTDFVLFKSDILEEDRIRMSRAVAFSVVSQKEGFRDFHQDFKYAWMVFALKRIAEIIFNDPTLVAKDDPKPREDFLQLMGYELAGKSLVPTKWRGALPPIASGKVRLSFNVEFFRAEFEGDIKPTEKIAEVSLGDFARRAVERLTALNFTGRKLYMFFDELEVFRLDEENFTRDIRMVRDLLFTISDLNRQFLAKKAPIFLVGAVRSEVLGDVRHIGEEIGRTVRDLGVHLEWYAGSRDRDHPLMQIVQKKLRQSEIALYGTAVRDSALWGRYFDERVGAKSVERYLLDASFMRPRDIIRRLSVCARLAPGERKFSAEVLGASTLDYSREMWTEIAEELVPRYHTQEVKALEQLLYGYFTRFVKESFEVRLASRCKQDPFARQLRSRGAVEILSDLFRLGAVGNVIRRDDRQVFSWYYSSRQTFDPYGSIVIHPSLWTHLALSTERGRKPAYKQRGSAGRPPQKSARSKHRHRRD